MSELNDALIERAKDQVNKLREEQKKRYQYARSLGFPASEAIVLQNWKIEKITAIAKERKYI